MQAANAGVTCIWMLMTWTLEETNNQTTGNHLGMSKDMKMNGSGEMDNGYSWLYFANYADGTAGLGSITSAAFTMNMDTMGSVTVSQGSGSAVSLIDDKTPSAYEESWDSLDNGLNLVGGVSSGTLLRYALPELPFGTKVVVAYNPDPGATKQADGGTAAGTNSYGAGVDATATTGLAQMALL